MEEFIVIGSFCLGFHLVCLGYVSKLIITLIKRKKQFKNSAKEIEKELEKDKNDMVTEYKNLKEDINRLEYDIKELERRKGV